jgi:hypothetical protein
MRCVTPAAILAAVCLLPLSRVSAANYNVPPDPLPSTLIDGDILNFGPGAVAGETLHPLFTVPFQPGGGIRSGSTINVSGGQFGTLVAGPRIGTGSVLNLLDGRLGAASEISGGTWNVFGGTVDPLWYMNQGTLNVYGGNVRSAYRIDGGQVNLFGGALEVPSGSLGGGSQRLDYNVFGGKIVPTEEAISFTVGGRTLLNLHGGQIQAPIRSVANATSNGGRVNLFLRTATLDGSPLAGLAPGLPLTVLERDKTLAGLLADGSPFSFELNSALTTPANRDFFPPGSIVTVTLVPEPAGALVTEIALACLIRRRWLFRRSGSCPQAPDNGHDA